MAGPAAFILLSFIGSIAALVGVYGASGLQTRAAPAHRYPSLG